MVIGALAGILSVCGFQYIQVVILSTMMIITIIYQPMLLSKLKIHDTCGVNNLHGMPGMKTILQIRKKPWLPSFTASFHISEIYKKILAMQTTA